jgi:hypothetical protein
MERQTGRCTDGLTDERQIDGQADGKIERDRQTHRDRADREKDTHIGRQREREREREGGTDQWADAQRGKQIQFPIQTFLTAFFLKKGEIVRYAL